ncbi:Sporulation-like domain containing protein [Paracoccaceae bacterium]
MYLKLISVAVVAAVFGAGSAEAQSVARVGGPANLPPAGFEGQQWVDSRGCVFLKAGYGGQVNWVPRVGRDRRAMCGYPPTGTTRAAIEVATEAEMAAPAAEAAPAPRVMAAMEPVVPVTPRTSVALRPAPVLADPVAAAPKPSARPAPYVEVAPSGGYEVVASSGPGAGQIGCYSSAPVAERVKTRNGGTVVVCTRGDGTLTGWRPPVYPQGAGVGAALTDPVVASRGDHGGNHFNHGVSGRDGDGYSQGHAVPTPPKGYKLAWKDDRLNPNRGKGTAQGWADQDQVWTRKVPSELVAEQPATKRKKKVFAQSGTTVITSTKGQAATASVEKKAAKGGAFIQVGTFGVVSNADGAAARLQGMGLPVARAKITSGGRAMQIVMAGPFRSAADAAAALSMALRAGFGDAFIR